MTMTSRVGSISASESEINARTAGQKNLVIVGATGMVGGYALRYALAHPAVGLVTTIGRRKVGISHPKLKEVRHQDFADCSALAEVLSDQHAAIFCLGAYTGAVSDTELRTITVDYTIEFARVLHGSSPDAAFAFLSGSGADPTGRSRMSFARYKGEAENALLARGFAYLPTRVHLPGNAAARAEFRLSPVARDLPRVSGVIPQPGHSSRRLGPSHDGGRGAGDRGTSRAHFREPRHPSHSRVAAARDGSQARRSGAYLYLVLGIPF
jgi:hypothetical protein